MRSRGSLGLHSVGVFSEGKGEGKGETHLLEFRVAACEFVVDIAGKVFEAGSGEGGEFLAGLVTFWMEIVADGEERDCWGGT